MKIAFVYSENHIEYNQFVQKILEILERKTNENIEYNQIISKVTRKKYDLYIVISNDMEDFEFNLSKIKDKPLLITRNLKSAFIEKVIDSVIDIVYLDGKIDVISNRIIDVANKAKCLKQ